MNSAAESERVGDDQRLKKREKVSSLEKYIQLGQAQVGRPQPKGTCVVSSSGAQRPRTDKRKQGNRFMWGWKFPSGDEAKIEDEIAYSGCLRA